MDLKKSPLAPEFFPTMPIVDGVQMATAETGLKYKNRPDLLLFEFKPGTSVAGVLTKSTAPGNPVVWCRNSLSQGKARGLIVNAGNANVFTGKSGIQAVETIAKSVSEVFHSKKNEVFVASTGVIGESFDPSKITQKIPNLAKNFLPQDWKTAATAITTTDTFPKGAHRTVKIGQQSVNLVGIAKGSGMIAPDMATMLGFIFTDAQIPASLLQALLNRNVQSTFNSITVDGDTSTSDTLLLFATGSLDNYPALKNHRDPILKDFEYALNEVMLDLAKQIVRDGEGAQKLISVKVTGAVSPKSARRIGLSIANSPLVKTAIAGEDANWGRVVMAVGKSGEKADRDQMSVTFGGIKIAKDGQVVDNYDEKPVTEHMQGRQVNLKVDVGVGRSSATVWTCDLTHGYISINADYRS
ncbi:MAG: bifunctional glutamate N-acetyltransferase/amino-acid acetyltransferase ArgJ [Rhodospirillaceae bacterium]|nr:bifunctional glutamate N-acetyltransferase/amino-acid acetyltransferase ArgJ [Rhodospirillaceae bacterium]